ncbi:5-oxoprolinase/urea amidolyase family protein [Variovorax paradoxus]|uniref:5-oxoprolinase/urea amidolyase family protein n=1 Tax=Variovorax paradoxus TaxID=34073 RepID=A0A5Q0MG63_VARPD|nr:urea amidolyase family protein [Variovorax paradoxus]QFZ87525.1 5-oxoprolinase/urea amidolyase family protein [Variovorax paradoxus]
MRFLPVNLNAVLVELDDLAQTLALLASLRAEPIAGIEELVPAARTILITFRPAALSAAALAHAVRQRKLDARETRVDKRIEIPVRYDGEDIAEVAGLLGITPDELVRRHTGSDYTVAFTGFAPGFAYLSGGHPSLNVPRRAVPRTRIPAGAVGLAGSFSGVYPQASPGGWQIIGVTDTPMWDLSRETPALLQPGDTVRFVDATALKVALPVLEKVVAAPAPVAVEGGCAFEVRAAGLQALWQDGGRHGQARQGVSASGAMDQRSLQAANRLVGNASDMACLELAYGGLQFVCRGDAVMAVTGADGPVTLTRADGAQWPLPRYQPVALADGDTVSFGEPVAGIRSYLAVRGGFAVTPVLGSWATDTLARIGPPAVVAGDVLPMRAVAIGAVVGTAEAPPTDLPTVHEEVVLDIVLGPRTDWFTADAVERLCSQPWVVTPQSNRVGIRLNGEAPLVRANTAELPSEGTARGSIQVPPSGQPVLFLADHPLTGGYPVIASVATHHLDRAGQIPVNARVRFQPMAGLHRVHGPIEL